MIQKRCCWAHLRWTGTKRKCPFFWWHVSNSLWKSWASCPSKEEKAHPHCYQRRVQKEASVMVWWRLCATKINAEGCIQMLEQHLLPMPSHILCTLTQRGFRVKKMRVEDLPACGPDLSPSVPHYETQNMTTETSECWATKVMPRKTGTDFHFHLLISECCYKKRWRNTMVIMFLCHFSDMCWRHQNLEWACICLKKLSLSSGWTILSCLCTGSFTFTGLWKNTPPPQFQSSSIFA